LRHALQMNIVLTDCNINLNSSFTNRPKCYYFCDITTDKQTRKCNRSRLTRLPSCGVEITHFTLHLF